MAWGFAQAIVGSTGRKYGCWMFVRQWTIVGMLRVFSKVAPGDPLKFAPPTTVPFWTKTVVEGNPAGNIWTLASESLIVYSLRITWHDEFLITVGCHTGRIGSCFANFVIMPGSRGTSFG